MYMRAAISTLCKRTAILLIICMLAAFIPQTYAKADWAADSAKYCLDKGIIQGDSAGNLMLNNTITRAQMAKMLTVAFDLKATGSVPFDDIPFSYWYFKYASAVAKYMPVAVRSFIGNESVSRQEFIATLMRAAGYNDSYLWNEDILSQNFWDDTLVNKAYRKPVSIAVERAFMKGYDGYLDPNDNLTRAESCAFIQRVLQKRDGSIELTWEDLGVTESETELIGDPEVTVEEAQAWARNEGAADIYVNIAPIYWKYGKLTGLRADLLYAQAAKETGFGHYDGAVTADMNNWAGIKTKEATGDKKSDHETFATPDDGVRAHFNHMSAYVGLKPIGTPHARYYVLSEMPWAGEVQFLEALGGRWCPNLYYGYSILHDLYEPMLEYKE